MLITFEGIDCSGKETQSNALIENLKKQGKSVIKFSFPCYESPTGKIISGPYLGKNMESYFEEPSKVDPYVASLYFAADRLYNIKKIKDALRKYDYVIIDRYVYSNMAHQGCKLSSKKQDEFFDFIESIEFEHLKLPKPDLVIFLRLRCETVLKLLKLRKEKQDGHERDLRYLKNAEKTYLKLCNRFGFKKIYCEKMGNIDNIESISKKVLKILNDYERKNIK